MSGFGDFTWICERTPFPVCETVGPISPLSGKTGIDTTCYARSVEIANTTIFEMAASFVHIIALIMTVIMIMHVRSKFTAVGRKEITLFFYLYIALTIDSLILDAGVVPPTSGAFPYFVAIQNGLTSALCTCLLINGFVGFQLYEDGTAKSMWMIRGCTATMFVICGLVSILTFNGQAGLSPTNTIGLFVVLFLINAVFLSIYVVMQLILVVNTLQDRWPLGDILFGVFFFVAGQLIVYVFGEQICEGANHYLDGLVFATCTNLLAVMMVYKYWDSITKEDLEFSVGAKQGNWEVKEPYSDSGDRTTAYFDDPPSFAGSAAQRHSAYGDRRQSAVYGGGY